MFNISHRHFYKLAKRESEFSVVRRMKTEIKKDPAVIKKFKEYGVSLDAINKIPVSFVDLDVSAKTKNKNIYINRKFLDDVDKASGYLCHEVIHYLQQLTGNMDGADKKEYLNKDTEEEAFQTQIDYKKRHEGESEAEDYTEHLIEYHNVPKNKRKEKKEELMDGP